MNTAYQTRPISAVKQVGWWLFLLVCVFYGIYALAMGITEILHLLGIVNDARSRAAPFLFVVHALSGSVALISGPLQFNRLLRNKHRNLHRALGRLYVWAIWISSIGGLWSVIFFNVNIAAKIAFGTLAILWFSATTVAYLRIRHHKLREHREWMIRSFALSLFFVTFSFWTPGLASTNLPQAVAYPLGVFVSWLLNLIIAELWIRRTRSLIVSSALPLARIHPSALKATDRTQRVWRCRMPRTWPLRISHKRTVRSELPAARVIPSGLKATETMISTCLWRMRETSPVFTSHNRTVGS